MQNSADKNPLSKIISIGGMVSAGELSCIINFMNIFKKIHFYTALLAAKTVNRGLHLMKHAGTSLPGVVALKIQKDFISFANEYCQKKIITITGTNGKTTTAGILAHILKTAQNNVLHNEKGANMLSGIASSLAVNYKPFSKFDYAVLESDEAYLTKLYDFLRSDYLLVTNLFRDQLDRYGELDTTAKKIQEAISKNPGLTVFLNADDPMLAGLAPENERIYYGFDDISYKNKTEDSQSPMEAVVCKCKTALSYVKRFYAHIGKYFCKNCQNSHPEPNYKGKATIYTGHSEISVEHGAEKYDFTTNLVGLYNAYNVLAAVSAALELNIRPEIIQKALQTYKSVFGRSERRTLNGRNLLIQLIKNPTGASEVLRTVNADESAKLLIIINDKYADGRDVSWLWDADFEILQNYPNEIVLSGIRAYDMATRLKYAGFPPEKMTIKPDIKTALNYSAENIAQGAQLLIMPTYTALLELQHIFGGSDK